MKKIYQVEKDNYEDAGQVSRDIKKTLKILGIDPKVLKRVSIACYEAEINLVIHSNGGTILFEVTDNGTILLSFDDIGPGIPNIDLALTPGWSTASKKAREFGFGAGMGLDNMKNCASTFQIESSSEGTHLKMSFV
jgi:Anti-sigma regulatory factor (Ser/Thr protein kinase)